MQTKFYVTYFFSIKINYHNKQNNKRNTSKRMYKTIILYKNYGLIVEFRLINLCIVAVTTPKIRSSIPSLKVIDG